MQVLILPGYSPHNRDWAYDLQKYLGKKKSYVHEWGHWKEGNFRLNKEIDEIIKTIGDEKFSFIAKSVGTRVLMHLLPKMKSKIGRVILCGIPTKADKTEVYNLYKVGINSISPDRIIIFQNSKDPFAKYSTIEKFVNKINNKVKVIEKPASNHEYYYFEDFSNFLL